MSASLEIIAQRAASSIHTVRATHRVCFSALSNGTPGTFVECGVFLGANAAAMAKVASACEREVHLFDSFAGIPQAGPEDPEFLAAGHQAGLSCATEEQVRAHMREWRIDENVLVYHPGWFADTIPKWAATKPEIAVLRLDADIYESTKVAIEYLWPLVSPGGWVIVDDWNLSGARKAVMDAIGQPSPVYFQKHT